MTVNHIHFHGVASADLMHDDKVLGTVRLKHPYTQIGSQIAAAMDNGDINTRFLLTNEDTPTTDIGHVVLGRDFRARYYMEDDA